MDKRRYTSRTATLRFPPFVVDTTSFTLTRDGVTVPLFPRYVEVLAYLVSRPGDVISKSTLLETFWRDVAVTDNTVEQAIGAARQVLGDDPLNPRFIKTIKGRGYCFIGTVDTSGAPPQQDMFAEWSQGKLSLETLNAEELLDATASFERAVARKPNYAPAHAAVGNAYFQQYERTRIESAPNTARLECAISHAQRAWQLEHTYAEAAATVGYLLAHAGDVENALRAARHATMLRPDIWRHQFRLAAVCWGDERIDAVAETLSLKQDFAQAYLVGAMVFIARQNFAKAEEYAAKGAALQSENARLRASASAGQARSALTFPSFGLHWLRGLLFLRRGEVKKALECFEREIREGKRAIIYFREYRFNALLGTGYAHLAAGDPQAADAFRGALEVLPANARALLGLRQALTQRGLDEEAEATARRVQSSLVAMTKGGRNVEVALVSASVDAARGNHKAAAATLQKLLEQAPPGQIGWMIPIDPALQPLRDHPAFAGVRGLLSSRAD